MKKKTKLCKICNKRKVYDSDGLCALCNYEKILQNIKKVI